MSSTKRICMWCCPRNISTALMYSFAQRSDTTVVDEPLYAHYLTSTDADRYHPGAEEIIADQINDGQRVVDEVILGEYETPVAFFKMMTHHLVDLDWDFMKKTVNIILTRNPREMLPSFVKQVPDPKMKDVGYAKHLEVLEYLDGLGKEHRPVVVDSKEILMDPRGRLSRLCSDLGLSFEEEMLSWEEGPRPEDGIWAEHWYHNVHRSTGFKPYRPKTAPFPEDLKELLDECRPIYDRLIAYGR